MATLIHQRYVLILILLLTACSAPPLAPTVTSVPSVTSTLEPTATLTNTTFPIGVFSTQNQDGQWIINFLVDGMYTVNLNGEAIVRQGQYVITDQQITLEDDAVVCASEGAGQYTWSFAQDVLTLTPLNDPCTEREAVMTNGLVKQP